MRDFVYITIIAADFASREQNAEAAFTGAINSDAFSRQAGQQTAANPFAAEIRQQAQQAVSEPAQPAAPAQDPDDDIPSFLRRS